MTYATQQDLVDRFGYEQLAQLSDRINGTVIDAAVVARALADADAEIDGYLATLYALPLASVPALILRVACDIARYRLFGDRMTDQVKQFYADAVRDLKAISSGTIKIGGAASLPIAESAVTVRVNTPPRRFGADALETY